MEKFDSRETYLKNDVQRSSNGEISTMSTNQVSDGEDDTIGKELEDAVKVIEREGIDATASLRSVQGILCRGL